MEGGAQRMMGMVIKLLKGLNGGRALINDADIVSDITKISLLVLYKVLWRTMLCIFNTI